MAEKTKKTVKKKVKKNYIYAVGRRKVATARVRLFTKKGDNLVNGKSVKEYFPGEIAEEYYMRPLEICGVKNKFSFSAKIGGSGKKGQMGALVHGLARALVKHDSEAYRSSLKRVGLLTRDSRMKETRKVGTGGKARRKKQSPKR